jgi:hypothetical protein
MHDLVDRLCLTNMSCMTNMSTGRRRSMCILPDFDAHGVLPPGDYPLTIEQLHRSKLVLGPGDPQTYPTWDAAWRERLVGNLQILVKQLVAVGIKDIWIDGSFVEDKDHPNDIDGYFACDLKRLAFGNLQRELNLLDVHKIWTWDEGSRRPCPGFAQWKLPMWHKYRVELYPHYGQLCGIGDQYGHELEFPSAFRQSRRTLRPKGIVRIVA